MKMSHCGFVNVVMYLRLKKTLHCLDMDYVNNRKWLDTTSLKYYSHLELFIVHFVF